ncbi:YcnI family copper-binding membrane protein [Zhihengliuella flava]|uniref:Uncharacterized protein YcnI n=1 Tax=Zhihengliuella flava TaxID=1285193 RepID=A0A931GLJ5_9MICC|nr:YcnI family protein [Zhihengliuella flava]MBG6084514.1 uncharacterized protein YcnI [Zhihengliuella flava]
MSTIFSQPAHRRPARAARSGAAAVVLAASAALVAAPAASAHVELEATTTAAGAYPTLTFAIGHGCEGSPTESVTIDFPEEIGSVKPTAKPGWDVEVATEGERHSVTYTADEPLPDELRDTVSVAALLPLDGEAGDVLTFDVTQTCTEGENLWNETSEDGAEPEYPAPQLTLTAAEEGGSHGSHGTTENADGDAAGAEEGGEHADHGGEASAAETSSADKQARMIATGGLVVGVLGVALATVALRRQQRGSGR